MQQQRGSKVRPKLDSGHGALQCVTDKYYYTYYHSHLIYYYDDTASCTTTAAMILIFILIVSVGIIIVLVFSESNGQNLSAVLVMLASKPLRHAATMTR